MAMSDRSREFFTKLAALCAEYDAHIGGCGCCGSPYVTVDAEAFDDLEASKDGCGLDGSWNRRNDDGSTIYPLERCHVQLVTADGKLEVAERQLRPWETATDDT